MEWITEGEQQDWGCDFRGNEQELAANTWK